NRDNVTQFFVALERLLHATGNGVVLFANDLRIELTAGGVERIDGGVDTQRSDVTRKHHGRVQVLECGGRRGVGQVVSRNVNGLNRRDGARLGRSDTLLQLTHFFGQRGLITHGRRHTAKQGGHFGTCQRVAIDVIDEEQNVTSFVAELL